MEMDKTLNNYSSEESEDLMGLRYGSLMEIQCNYVTLISPFDIVVSLHKSYGLMILKCDEI